jgi:hypothetical protein
MTKQSFQTTELSREIISTKSTELNDAGLMMILCY